jgi:hypothetical protein
MAGTQQGLQFLNPKFEYRNPKQIRIFKFKIHKLSCFEHLKFGHLRLFRVSDFVLRI